MALGWCSKIICNFTAPWFPLLFSVLLWQMAVPVHAVPSCPRSCSCPAINEVHCTFRHLFTIPKTFPKDTEKLNLGYNSLTEVEGSEFRSLRQLEMLMLHGNDISTIHPGAFYSLRSLQILKLSYNKLTSVNPGVFEGLVGLIRLHLDHNLIDFIEPYSFSGLSSLKLLQLEGNLLKEIHPHTFITVSLLGSFWTSGLKHLHISDNLLEQLPTAALQTTPRLELLSLHGNPWTCDCQLQWLVKWSVTHEGVIKCKKERGSSEICPQCSLPKHLNGSHLLELTPEKLTCERPVLRSPLKQFDSPLWTEGEAELDLPYTRDFEKPLGHVTIVLSDSHGNNAHVACDVRHPEESVPITWTVNPQLPAELTVNVTLVTALECEIDREMLQNLWQLVAYYYESPAVLERGQKEGNSSQVTYQYAQAVNENSPYFTELKGYLVGEPSWLLQPRVKLRLNRQQTTTKKLVMDFTTYITKNINSHKAQVDDNDLASSWAMISRGSPGRVQIALEGSKVYLQCTIITSDPRVKIEWMLPDLSLVESASKKLEISEKGELVISNVTLSDSGLYHCLIRTKVGIDLLPLRLTIKERLLGPKAFNGQEVVAEKGNSFSLPCEVNSVQPSQTVWYLPKNKVLLPTQKTRRAEVMENGTLVVRKLTIEDAGEYSCLASNLYGVDMLSHVVEVTGEKAVERQAKTEKPILPFGIEEGEGSGGDFQEIVRPFATQLPENVQEKNLKAGSKRLRLKNPKRKPNISVKEVDPDRWKEILAKANIDLSVALPTERSLEEPNTVTPWTSETKTIVTTVSYSHITTAGPDKTLDPITTKEIGYQWKISDTMAPSLQTAVGNEDKLVAITNKPDIEYSLPTEKSVNSNSGEGKRTSNFVPVQSNRRRPYHRRRKPFLRKNIPHKNPFYNSANKYQTTAYPTTTTTTTTTSTTTLITTTMTPIPTTVEDYENLSAEYETKDDGDYYDEYKYTNRESLGVKENVNRKHLLSTPNPRSTFTPSIEINYNLPDPKLIAVPMHNTSTLRTDEKQSKESSIKNKIFTSKSNGHLITALEKQEKLQTGTESSKRNNDKSQMKPVTPSYSTQNNVKFTIQSRTKPNTRPSPDQHRLTHGRTSPSNPHLTRSRVIDEVTPRAEKTLNKPTMKIETHNFPVMEPLHPWLHSTNQGRGQATTSKVTGRNQDRNTGKKNEVSPGKHVQPPRVPPTSHWSSQNNPYHHYPLYPSRSFKHAQQGHNPPATQLPWSLHHPWAHGLLVTNRPEITAETIKPTPTISVSGSSRLGISNAQNLPNYHGNNRNQIRDQLFLSRLRNRYRQAQLDRITQLGRMVTPKPRSRYHNHPLFTPKPKLLHLHRPYTPRPPPPTASYTAQLTHHTKQFSSSFTGFDPTPFPRYLSTLDVQHGGRWLVREGKIGSLRPTAAPPFPWFLGGGGDGGKPRITTITSASVSVLAESDVFLPCKATGHPEPNIAWTQVSTGATIPANTKHSLRFEVFNNGTLVLRNIQLQDRGQYLCTAQNRFGSDRMVITLAVQTEAPKIQQPKSTEIAVYVGKTVTLECLASGKPPAQISWILPDRTFVRETGTIHTSLSPMSLLQNGTLQIHSANFSSKGDYKCIASNAAGADTITYHLHVAALPPSISEGATDTVNIPAGTSMFVHCSVKGKPEPALRWMLPSGIYVKPSQFVGRRLFVFPNGTLYECLASNTVGFAKRTIQLEVTAESSTLSRQQPPPLPIPPVHRHTTPSRQHTVSAMYGSAVYLHCPESAKSTRGTTWQLPSKMVLEHRYSPERPIKVFRNGTLRILQLTEKDGGNYVCFFQRPNGEDKELFEVKVLMTPPRIEQVRAAQTSVTFGDNFQVDCVATGLPDPEVSWSLPDGTLINNALQSDDSGHRNRRYIIFGNGTLLLQQMGKKDEGDYTCYAKNQLGKDERKVSIKVGPNAPKIGYKSPSVVTVNLGQSVQLSCTATGDPTPRILWISPRQEVIPASSNKFQIMEDGSLVLKKVTLADEGKYACVARNSVGDDVKNMEIEVEPQEPYINEKKWKSSLKVLGVSYQTVLLDCKVEGKPEPRVWWVSPYGVSLTVPYRGGRFTVHQNGSLELRGARKTDEGKYMCKAQNPLGEASLLVELQVASIAEKPIFAVPNIEIIPIKQDGKEMLLECTARGKPNPELSWVLPNGTILLPGVRLQRFRHHFGNGTLQISQPAPADKGVYRCIARNVAGQAGKQYALEAGRKPVIRGSTGGMKITFGLNINLPCNVDGWPQASITWTLPNGVVLDKPQTIGRISFFANGTLHLRQIATFDKGTYTCKASNPFGSSILTYPVSVMVFPPRITSTLPPITRVNRGSTVTIKCVATGIPKPDISWTLPGRTTLVPNNRYTAQGGIHMTGEGNLIIQNPVLMNSGIYKCNAKNALGTDFKSTYLQVF
ncbi:matrix-remodeling-associated protein 5 isoform X2 [Gouania willdenowi]|uniref:matrix-remodeling-associated protein 5 isoform X2 n=1 Tax=Gouania willdenowi TaxID=441366 RepID=UPI0010554747|nr:matrix-remodeling-associated protein 5-like isoform X2 [Gouania willdenowi]